jgi:hypothetical protein
MKIEETYMVVDTMIDYNNKTDDSDCLLEANPNQLGEKGHLEHSWEKSTNIHELLLQLNFQLVREEDENKVLFLENIQRKILDELMTKLEQGSIGFLEYEELITINYKLVAYTRDIISGKGEYTLSYMLINVWYEFFPELAKFMLRSFLLHPNDNNTHPFGSWKDVKYFCNYCIHCGYSYQYPLIEYAFQLVIEQLKGDSMKSKDTELSLVSKWIPREKSKRFGWIFKELSQLYFEKYIQSTNKDDPEKMIKAKLKCKTDFRKLIAGLNKRLGTIQINQCAKTWSKIDCKNITSITFSKQSKALLNLNQSGKTRYALYDRIQCSNHTIMNIYSAILKNGSGIKGKRTSLSEFVKRAIRLIEDNNSNQNECDLLNLQWNDFLRQIDPLGPMIPLVDLSETMNGEPFYNAIGMACIIAQKSGVERILTFSATSQWHNLSLCKNLIDMVRHLLMKSNRGMNSNFYGALDKILTVFMEEDFTREIVNGMTLVVLSDMQIHACFNDEDEDEDEEEDEEEDEFGSFYDMIEQKYKDANRHYKPPHVLFWNLRNTNGFPTHSTKYNASMISGYQPSILNSHAKKGNLPRDTCNPWFMFSKQFNIKRYKFLEEKVSSVLNQ